MVGIRSWLAGKSPNYINEQSSMGKSFINERMSIAMLDCRRVMRGLFGDCFMFKVFDGLPMIFKWILISFDCGCSKLPPRTF